MTAKVTKRPRSVPQLVVEAGGVVSTSLFHRIIDPKLSPATLLFQLILSNTLFVTGAAACFFLYPQIVLTNEAFSTYGTLKLTIIPYSFAIAGTALATSLVALRLSRSDRPLIEEIAPWYSFLSLVIVGVWATPFDLNRTMYFVHTGIVGLMMLLMVVIVAKFTGELDKLVPRWSILPLILCYIALLYGAVISAFSLKVVGVLHQLFLGEMLTIAAFTLWSLLFVIVGFYAKK